MTRNAQSERNKQYLDQKREKFKACYYIGCYEVPDINQMTGKLYRYCNKHRQSVNEYRRKYWKERGEVYRFYKNWQKEQKENVQ